LNSGVFSRNLYQYRVQKRMTQREVADEIGVRQQTVAAWEANRSTPSPDIICNLAQIFKITTDELLLENQLVGQQWPLRRLYVPKLKRIIKNREALFSEENIAGEIEMLGRYDIQYFAIEVEDDSMSPMLLQGDLAILECTTEITGGQIYAFLCRDESIVLRRAEIFENQLLLVPANTSKYACNLIENAESSSADIVLGKISHSIRNW
jgi:putative transcriptional regulator